MATQKTDTLPGSTVQYKVYPNAKRYTLRDNAFTETKNGSFQYERPLTTIISDKTAPKIKITVSKDITELKLSTVNAKGLKKVDLYKSDGLKDARDFAEHILQNLVEEGVLEKV